MARGDYLIVWSAASRMDRLDDRGSVHSLQAPAAAHDEETIMNILLWYLPYAMFSGACDVVLAEGGTRTGSERRADSAERERETDEPALAA
jgi:hypothetical protein